MKQSPDTDVSKRSYTKGADRWWQSTHYQGWMSEPASTPKPSDKREVAVACCCGHTAILFIDRDRDLPTAIRCTVCNTSGPTNNFIQRAHRRGVQSDGEVALVMVDP